MTSRHATRRYGVGRLHPDYGRFQRGAALIVALMMLTVVMMLSTSAVQTALQEEKASRNGRDRLIALQAAEAALDDAVQDIERSHRSHVFSGDYPEGLVDRCGGSETDLYRGVCGNPLAATRPVWQKPDFVSDEQSLSVPYGQFTDRRYSSGTAMAPARLPRYVIELITRRADALDEDGRSPERFFRITAIGFGVRDHTRVVVQSFYRKSDDGEQASVPARLFGWREIVNWEELHNASTEK